MSGTPTLFARGLVGRNLFGFAPAGGSSPSYPLVHAVYFVTTSITLKWHNPGPGLYNKFNVQVSLLPDFSTTIRDDSTLTDNNTTFTDSSTNDARRYWRWRGSSNSGTTWGQWSRVGSYWLNTSGSENVSLPRNSWMLINPSPVTDRFLFSIFPFYKTTPQHQYRARLRNRLGTILSEYITIKALLDMSFDQTRWLYPTEFSEIRRFNETVKTFYVAMFHDYTLGQPVPNIWKVQLAADPDLALFTAGRQDLLTGVLQFTEV